MVKVFIDIREVVMRRELLVSHGAHYHTWS